MADYGTTSDLFGGLDPNLSFQEQMQQVRANLPQQIQDQNQAAYGPASALPTAQPAAVQPTPGENGQPKIGEHPNANAPGAPEDHAIQSLTGLDPNTVDKQTKKAFWEYLQQTNPNNPKETIGNPKIGELLTGQKGGMGGILGLGIQPIDVLAFALGAAITSKLPQSQAIAATMKIAGLPGQLRATQQKAGDEYIKSVKDYIGMQQSTAQLQNTQIQTGINFNKYTQGLEDHQKKAAMTDMIRQGVINLDTDAGHAAAVEALGPEAVNAIHKIKQDAKPPSPGGEAERIAQSQFGVGYADTTQPQKQAIEQQINKYKEEAAIRSDRRLAQMSRAMDMSQGRLDATNAKTLTNVVDINGKSAATDSEIVQSNKPYQAALKKGMHYLNRDQLQSLDASNLVLTQLDRMEYFKNKLFKGVAPGENILNNAKLKALYAAGDPDARGFYSLLYEMLPVSTRASGLTSGAAGRMGIIGIEEKINFNRSDTWGSWETKDKQLKQRMLNNRKIAWGAGIDPELGASAERAVDAGNIPAGYSVGKPQKVQ